MSQSSESQSSWSQVPSVRVPSHHLKRSSSHSRSTSHHHHTESSADHQLRLHNRRSVSAERGAWAATASHGTRVRDRERFVRLPVPYPHSLDVDHILEEDENEVESELDREPSGLLSPLLGPLDVQPSTGRITCSITCISFQREQVFSIFHDAFPGATLGRYPEVIHLAASFDGTHNHGLQSPARLAADVFIFDYGVVVCWGLTKQQEAHVANLIAPCKVGPLKVEDQHAEELGLNYAMDQPPQIKNDTITLSKREACDHMVKMAISHALAQSCKLKLYEARVADLVSQVRHLPQSLALHGEVRLSRQQIARIKGQVFIQKSEVNLLSTVLDTPDFFWDVPDALRVLYDKVCEYCELPDRIELVNSRTMLIQSMLHIWGDHQEHNHMARLDRIIIILIFVEVVIAAVEVLGLLMAPVTSAI